MTNIKIEAGKYYRTRDGQKVGPMRKNMRGPYADSHPWRGTSENGKDCWRANGSYATEPEDDPEDLVAEWRDAPDLTAITTPFGLLDRETQEALKAHGGPWHFFSAYDGWQDAKGAEAAWVPGTVYRVKPAPPKPREFWVNVYPGGIMGAHSSKEDALRARAGDALKTIHVREVLPE